MKLKQKVSLGSLASKIGGRVVGNENAIVEGLNEIHRVERGDLCFAGHLKYLKPAMESKADFIIVPEVPEDHKGKDFIVHPDPFKAYNLLAAHYRPHQAPFNGVYPDKKGNIIHPGVQIGEGVEIGSNCIIYPNVVIYNNVILGDNVIIHANCVIGGDAFYYNGGKEGYDKWHSIGGVEIGSDVEIGAGTTIDKGVSSQTRIGEGTKIDNLCHIGHGVEIGKKCIIAAQCGIGGKAIIGDEVVMWGQVGVSKAVSIGNKAVLSAKSGVSKKLEGGKAYFGSPAREWREAHKDLAALKMMAKEYRNKKEK